MRAWCRIVFVLVGALATCATLRAAETTDQRGKERLRFLVFGDAGTGERDQYLVGAHMAEICAERGGCDFALMLGDNIYRSGVRSRPDGEFDPRFTKKFERAYEPLGRLDFWAVAGNHDWSNRESVETEILYTEVSPRWRMPAHDYSIPDLPEWIRIYGLDTTKIRSGSGQIDRARASLCAGAGWKLLFGHHTIYSSGMHTDKSGTAKRIKNSLEEPLIESCGIQIYFAGHDHHQEHLQTLHYDQIVQGAGGKLRRTHDKSFPDDVRQLVVASRFGFGLVEVTREQLELRFYGYDDENPFGELHCRRYRRDRFDEPDARSVACED